MASLRGEIHMNELVRFMDWLKSYGWTIEHTKSYYEMLRVRKDHQIMLFYKREGSAHLSCSLEKHYIYWVTKYRTEIRRLKKDKSL